MRCIEAKLIIEKEAKLNFIGIINEEGCIVHTPSFPKVLEKDINTSYVNLLKYAKENYNGKKMSIEIKIEDWKI